MAGKVAAASLLLLAGSMGADLPTAGLVFHETFDDAQALQSGRWVRASGERYQAQELEIQGYDSLAENITGSYEGDLSLMLTRGGATYYAVSTKFPEPITNKNEELVVQYDLQLGQPLMCGGAYIKLLRADPLIPEEVDNNSPYTIMFGPDRCGGTNKVHFILQHQNPVSKEWEEKHFNSAPQMKNDDASHLYTLRIKPNNEFEMYIDKELTRSGNLLEDMTPAVNPQKMIDDPNDKKPADWVDEAEISDPDAVKPDDWDENAPMFLDDMTAEKPAGWLDDAPEIVPDPEAVKPEDWDDEEDGEWEAPLVPNPECDKAPGCGEWIRPKIDNPDYRGKWFPPKIENPAYKGEWAPRKIENANFFVDEHPHNVAPITGLAVEVMTTTPNIRFDNFVVSHSLDSAFKFADATMKHKLDAQAAKADLDRQEERRREREEKLAQGGFANLAEVWISDKLELLLANPYAAVATLLVAFLSLLMCAMPRSKKPAAQHERPVSPVAPTTAATEPAEPTEQKEAEATPSARPAAPRKQRSKRAD